MATFLERKGQRLVLGDLCRRSPGFLLLKGPVPRAGAIYAEGAGITVMCAPPAGLRLVRRQPTRKGRKVQLWISS